MSDLKLLANERILQFKLSRDKSLIDDGYRALIMCSLYGKKVDTIEEISNLIEQTFNIKSIPLYIIQKYLMELIREESVYLTDGMYNLSVETKKELEDTLEKRTHIRNIMNKELIEAIKKQFDRKTRRDIKDETIINAIDDVMSIFFTRTAKLFSGLITEEERLIFSIPLLGEIIEERLENVENLKLRESLNESIIESLLKAPYLTYEYLFDMFEIYVYFEILNLNPETQINIPVEIIYLDTNVLLDLLLPSRHNQNTIVQIINISNELNIKNYYAKITSEELYNFIEDYKKMINAKENILKNMVKNDRGGIIESYFLEKQNNPSLTYEGYCLGLQKGYKNILLQKYGIEIDNNEYDEVKKESEKLTEIVSRISNEITREYKSTKSILHDAFCLELQKKNKTSWFITRDKSLFYVSQYLIESNVISRPLSVLAKTWLQALNFIRPSKNKRTSIDAFKEFMSTPLTSTLRPISLNKLISVAFPWIKEELLTVEDLEDLISLKFIDDYIIKPQQDEVPILTFEDIVPKMLDEKLVQKIQILEKVKEKVMAEKREIEDTINGIVESKLEDSLKQYKKTFIYTIKIKSFFYLGIIMILALFALIYLAGSNMLTVSDTIYYCLSFLALILIGASVFGESIFDLIKSLGKKP